MKVSAYDFFSDLWAYQVDKSNDMILVSAISYLIKQINDEKVRKAYEASQKRVRELVSNWSIDVSFVSGLKEIEETDR